MSLVTVGLPVFNGAKYISHAVESLLEQTFRDFTLIISDNGSTDGTPEICDRYQRLDPRVRFIRHDINRGAAWNFNFVFGLSKSPLFKWASYDDICLPECLEKCVEALLSDRNAVLAYPQTQIIDPHGQILRNTIDTLKVDSPDPVRRFHDLVLKPHPCFQVFGVMRVSALQAAGPLGAYGGADRTLLAAMALYGPFAKVPDYLFLRREHPEQSLSQYNHRSVTVWFDPSKHNKIVLLFWEKALEFARSVKRSPIAPELKAKCYVIVWIWMLRRWKNLLYDFKVAYESGLNRLRLARPVRSSFSAPVASSGVACDKLTISNQ